MQDDGVVRGLPDSDFGAPGEFVASGQQRQPWRRVQAGQVEAVFVRRKVDERDINTVVD